MHAILQQKVARQKNARQMAKHILDFRSEHWRMCPDTVLAKPDHAFQEVLKRLNAIRKIHRVTESEVNCIVLCNWSAPLVLSAEGKRRQAAVLSSIVNKPGCHNIGLVLTPSHANKRGLLWKEEELARNLLSQNACNLDTQFVITFGNRHDLREMRTV